MLFILNSRSSFGYDYSTRVLTYLRCKKAKNRYTWIHLKILDLVESFTSLGNKRLKLIDLSVEIKYFPPEYVIF